MTDLFELAEALKDAATHVPAERIPVLMMELATVQTLLAARLLTAPTPDAYEDDSECLTLAELAERMKLGESTVRAMVAAGHLRQGEHYARKGRKLLFFWSQVRGWLREPEQPMEPAQPAVIPFFRKGRRHG